LTVVRRSDQNRPMRTRAAVLAVAAAGWAIVLARMQDMDRGPGTTLGTLGFFVATWVAMMAAMMLPSAAPAISLYAHLHRRRRATERGTPGAVAIYVAGYGAVWTAAGVAAYAIDRSGRSLIGGHLAWSQGGRWLVAALLIVAAAWQLTPWKDACLARCRGPLGMFVASSRDGRAGAFRMGVTAGAWCFGCCWALMLSLFALGVMSLTWMALITALIAIERLVPWRAVATLAPAAVLVALAVGVAAAPAEVPGLTRPSGGPGMETMGMHR
jgi:predicted metal-binding membrane protein